MFGRNTTAATAAVCLAALAGAASIRSAAQTAAPSEDGQRLLTVDHYVTKTSTVPSISGETVAIYVRERVKPATVLRGEPGAGRVVLFVHGAGTPAEVAFDVPYADYSWMAYLASAGFDVFSMDMTGYGRSTRPGAMNDACNLTAEQQTALGRTVCAPSYQQRLTTIASDWDDLDAVVEYIRGLRGVERVSMIGWSLGGPRAGGYAARHPEKVEKLVLLAPAYDPAMSAEAPPHPAVGAAFNKQSHADFTANWDRQVGCAGQYEQAASDAIWTAMLASDPVGATWGQGVRRAPNTTIWGWGRDVVAKMKTPTLMVSGIHDKQVAPERVRQLYADLGAEQKVFVDLGCSSHNAMWERNHLVLFRASLEWLTTGTVQGEKTGMLKLGY
ncbi:MAG TPA: alpha/beta fold hydrolase [Gammaproteobacteria bacterium]|nr:alpha/beta fold hydrolase [Gammaproteobacteria bacterium]